jgi:hypothetical protein
MRDVAVAVIAVGNRIEGHDSVVVLEDVCF